MHCLAYGCVVAESCRYKAMADDGVVVRDRSSCLHCEGCLRVTVGTPDENAAFLASLKKHATYWFPRPIKSAVQQYAWGLMQDSSLVHSLGASNWCVQRRQSHGQGVAGASTPRGAVLTSLRSHGLSP